jgi:hypothetical protein
MIIPGQFGFNCPSHWNVLYLRSVYCGDRKSKMAATAVHRLTLDSIGKCSNAFSETKYMSSNWPSGFGEEA